VATGERNAGEATRLLDDTTAPPGAVAEVEPMTTGSAATAAETDTAGPPRRSSRAAVAEQVTADGSVVTASGRVSVARKVTPRGYTLPISERGLAALDEALTLASRATGLSFSIYLGELGDDTRATAGRLHAQTAVPSDSVLVAVSPGQRVVEVITGDEAHRRLPDRGCKLAVMSMAASFKEGDLAGGLVSGLRTLSDRAGTPKPR
jgi:hypothetical protein